MDSASKANQSRLNMITGIELIHNSVSKDSRGSFQRIYSQSASPTLSKLKFVQTSVSINKLIGTVRGIHYQKFPSVEWKYVTCLKGSIFDVLVDVRSNSPTYGEHNTFELTSESGLSVLIPPGVAHGYQCLTDEVFVHYQMTDVFNDELSQRLLWNDPNLGINWPMKPSEISALDLAAQPWPAKY